MQGTARGLLSPERLALVRSWRHSGVSVHVGREIRADDKPALERLARYLRRLHHSDSRIVYDDGEHSNA